MTIESDLTSAARAIDAEPDPPYRDIGLWLHLVADVLWAVAKKLPAHDLGLRQKLRSTASSIHRDASTMR